MRKSVAGTHQPCSPEHNMTHCRSCTLFCRIMESPLISLEEKRGSSFKVGSQGRALDATLGRFPIDKHEIAYNENILHISGSRTLVLPTAGGTQESKEALNSKSSVYSKTLFFVVHPSDTAVRLQNWWKVNPLKIFKVCHFSRSATRSK